MPRRRQAEKIRLIVKGEPSAKALPVEMGLRLPCMEPWRARLGISIQSVEGKLVRCVSSNAAEVE